MAYEDITIEIENDDREEWEEQLERFFMSPYIESIWRMDDYKTVIEFSTNKKDVLLETLQMIGDKHVLWYEVDEA